MNTLIDYGHEGLRPLTDNLKGETVVVNWRKLDRRFQSPRFQLFRPTGGTGCSTWMFGGKIFGRHVVDGEDGEYKRDDIIGIATHDLIREALFEPTPVGEINLELREYMLRAKDGSTERGKTVEEARRRLSYITNARVMECWELHPNSFINPFGYIVYPQGAPPTLMKLKKGKEWTAA